MPYSTAGTATSDEAVVRHILKSVTSRVAAIRQSAGAVSTGPLATVSDTLTAFVVRAAVLNPHHAFRVDAVFAKDDVDRLVELCARKLAADSDPESITVKAQVYFDSTFPQQAEYLHRENLTRKNTVAPILRDITEWSPSGSGGGKAAGMLSAAALDTLYRKMVGYVLLKSAMGNPTDVQVAREAAVALESVFPQGEVATFLALPRPDKERQLNGLAQLVSGIRLFNRHVNKASRDKIENIPELCSREIKDAFALIKEKTSDAELKIKAMAAILSAEPAVVAPDVSARMATALVFYRQLLIYLDSVREQIEASSAALRALDDKMAASLRDLAAACRARAAVPVDHVYPRFMELAALWRGFQDELFLDAFRRGILDTLALFESAVHMAGIGAAVAPSENTATDVLGLELVHLLAQAPASVRDAAQREPVEVAPMPDDAIVAAAATLQSEVTKVRHRPHLGAPGCDMEVLHPGNTAQYAKLPVELGGFCPVSLVAPKTLGLVVPGNWNHGVIKYRDKLYAFRTPNEAKQFAAAPEQYLTGVLDLARERMGLVQLLQLYGYFPSIRALENADALTRQALLGQRTLVCEVGTQVDTHIIDRNIDATYQWNEWEMRRRALMLVNLRTKQTHAAQTAASHYKRDAHAQVYPPRDAEAQTMRDAATGMPQRHVVVPAAVLGL
ncbi:hypothetical protein AMAG_08649 [Allomyces macrogynus ATCC 38327]|uniref:Cilia- and flagella-associated protein 206 n=1 Tax=Allomyces macrogynus (strain ATCC 38327) TaxID=578462 RepID=A0A0L0SM51_ALLM3|nr:hypothetical protein AMAG_08649 [Allomyces macrogynus ATCC 38327]|eukprot:KNE63533.1 hypothetical protein AMAG_08649 [Allomyces macrogynus ATCC 38327]